MVCAIRGLVCVSLVSLVFLAAVACGGGGGGDNGGGPLVQPTADGPWTPSDEDPEPQDEATDPSASQGFDLDVGSFGSLIESMGANPAVNEEGTELLVSLPLPNGTMEEFRLRLVQQRSVAMVQAQPEIVNFAGRGEAQPQNTLRGTWSPHGLHCMILHELGTAVIRTLDPSDPSRYGVHWLRDDTTLIAELPCLSDIIGSVTGSAPFTPSPLVLTLGATVRTYNIAFATTGEFTQWADANAGSVAMLVNSILSDINLVYGRDLAMQFTLIGLADAADPATDDWDPPAGSSPTNAEVNTWFAATQVRLETDFGVGSFDIGHLLTRGFGLGGVAQGSTACTGTSAHGISNATTSTPANALGYTIRVCHEMGHQLSAGHTWSAACLAGQFAPASACEPGSGTTIMSYGHNCSGDTTGEIGGGRHLSFHACSIAQINTYSGGGGNCFAGTMSANGIPSVTSVPAGTTIPMGTPFELTATGTDPDGDALQWTWDQADAVMATRNLCSVDDGAQPLFRSFAPAVGAETRTFPAMSVLLSDTRDTCAVNGLPGARGEQLPSMARAVMTFRATVRDAVPGGGGSDSADVVLAVDGSTGPFRVLTPNGGEIWGEGTTETVEWDVAGTDGAPINTANVAIELTTDQFATVTVLLASTPNDGSADVVMPACLMSGIARIRVRALGNVYFDISDGGFSVVDMTPPGLTLAANRTLLWAPRSGMMDVLLSAVATDNCSTPTRTLAIYCSEGVSTDASFAPAQDSIRLRAERDDAAVGRIYLVVVRATDAASLTTERCVSVVVPGVLTTGAIGTIRSQGVADAAACVAANGAPPAGYNTLLGFTAYP